MAQILAEGVEAAEASEALTPKTRDKLIVKEIDNAIHIFDDDGSQDPASIDAVGPQPAPISEAALVSQALEHLGRAGAVSGPAAEPNGVPAAAVAGADRRDAGSQGPAGQWVKLPGPQGNPLPSRRAGPAARSHSRRSMRELGSGIVEEDGKVSVRPSQTNLFLG